MNTEEKRIYELACKHFRKGETYKSQKHEVNKEALMRRYAEFVIDRYRRYNKRDFEDIFQLE